MTNLFVSFSGGKSSAYMAKRLLDEYNHLYNMKFVFANTGQENEKTLVFVDRCSKEWGLDVVWVEALVHEGSRIATTHKITNFEMAARLGEPFEHVIQKYGIPNKVWPHCTRELKLRPMTSYIRSLGWVDYLTAVGIRADEPRRIRKDAEQARIIYPMAHLFPVDKQDINDWWEDQSFSLGLLEHQGNCTWCWKKSLKKHSMIYKESPEVFDFPARMESLYGLSGHNEDGNKRVFFRGNRSTKDIISIAELFGTVPPSNPDEDSGCSESCEAF